MRFSAVLLVAFACSGTFASEPGQPLDCSDWVILAPGYSCVERRVCEDLNRDGSCWVGTDVIHVDVASALVRAIAVSTGTFCGANPLNRVEVFRDTDVRAVIAYVDDRCVDPTTDRIDGFAVQGGTANFYPSAWSLFDASKGQLIFPATSYSIGANSTPPYSQVSKLYAIAGFATTFDVLQTYAPQPALGFRVPYMPEGMAGADHFDTYWGSLAQPIDFTQAHPLQCGYTAAPPHAGEYLTVADTVPTPAPGQGVYYVTAATYQGATRYGRKQINGQMSGRDPALLPACAP